MPPCGSMRTGGAEMKIVFPVRFACHGGPAIQTTSLEMSGMGVRVMCPSRPPPAELVMMQLYLPDAHPPAGAIGRVRESWRSQESDGFWLDVVDTVRGVGDRVQALVAWAAERLNRPCGASNSAHRAMPRYPSSMPVEIAGAGPLISACARNLSASGVFVQTGADVSVGAVVDLKLGLPDRDRPVGGQAKVVHRVVGSGPSALWSEPGVGL